ncbi:serine protease [Lysinibacter sp. HNR]|nr:serine protease [Lysinibacter sp. HNR]WGD38697.1 serine protease [Lysinibacter sp. HNR]
MYGVHSGEWQTYLRGGSLLYSYAVLTAAHCFDHITDVSRLSVTVGRSDLNNTSLGQTRGVLRVEADRSLDVALVVLSESIDGILPVSLPTPGTDALLGAGTLATVMGWGNTNPDFPYLPNKLQKVTVPLVPLDECQIAWDGYPGMQPVTDANICAGKEKANGCHGDSGGPLVKKGRKDGKDVYYQIGVVSRGGSVCGLPGQPGVYVSTKAGFLNGAQTILPSPTPEGAQP